MTSGGPAPDGVVIVGAGAAGLSVAEGLRHAGFAGRLRMYGAEDHPPYDRPPLSKQVLIGTWQDRQTRLRDDRQLADLEVELHLGRRAAGLDTARRRVRLADGTGVRYDHLVIATGLTPRTLPGQASLAGVHVLHTLEDSAALRDGLARAHRVVIVGAGVLGCEIAASARTLGAEVTLVDPAPVPMLRQLGPAIGGLLAEIHRERGVRLRLSTGVDGLIDLQGGVAGVRLAGGEVLPADLVAVTIGGRPATGWLEGSALTLGDGVVCDDRGRAADRVWAVGDIARFPDPRTGALIRLENRTNATEQGITVAANILGADRPYQPLPYFWSDQYDRRIQCHGTPAVDVGVVDGGVVDGGVVDGAITDRRFVAVYSDGETLTGVVGFNRPKQTRLWRQHVLDRTPKAALPTPPQSLSAAL
ncbi:NADPH-dependent 2,4-dienoyl-CoA reductase/sulfur reductase-like enzyme [Catenuloplanes nepalensis]|uniref:NADPH-dependent 2,4-dienoyl-CoA reductase/sulfur reductase-like enzyme n=1 Tax=Catenuloplanes nepalensis TaxID=587533 RepID=A0ABT9MNP1_9ACTN|nr:FAD-dependent oxidoreductase [Catenuloplanes nepalensis]MDP9793009.1 NADPH-dependent 2,4-dienoyl-CoA reductase/sulfur reductase-like enzyme [Catenuloplanes nepalensis]